MAVDAEEILRRVGNDPIRLLQLFWPQWEFYDRQVEAVYAVRDSIETHVVAGNKLGKDFVSGFVALTFFLLPQLYFDQEYVRQVARAGGKFPHTRRVVTTSVKDDHLRVLWAEIARFVQESRVPLTADKGGPLVLMSREVRLAYEATAKNPLNYLVGMVSERGEGLSGHHAAYTLMIGDEASGIRPEAYDGGQGWAKRFLFIGNPNPCVTGPQHFFFKGIRGGDLRSGEAEVQPDAVVP